MVLLDKMIVKRDFIYKMYVFRLVSYKNVILCYCCFDRCDGFIINFVSFVKLFFICEYYMINFEVNLFLL